MVFLLGEEILLFFFGGLFGVEGGVVSILIIGAGFMMAMRAVVCDGRSCSV